MELVAEMFELEQNFERRDEARAVQMESTDVCRFNLFHESDEICRLLKGLFYPEYG